MNSGYSDSVDSHIEAIILRMARTGRVGNHDLDTLILHIHHLRQLAGNNVKTSVPPIER